MPLAKVQLMDVPGGPGITGAVKSGTGIIISGDGTISVNPATNVTKLIAGTNITLNPANGFGAVTITAAGGGGSGTITGVTPGTGLSGGGVSGNVTLNLIAPSGSNIGGVKAGSNITISADGTISAAGGGGSGTITGVTAGTGLSGGGTSGNVTLSNSGVTGLTAGANITLSGSTGNVTITASGGSSSTYLAVSQFGVIGNGTTDDTANLQAALNSLSSGGGRLFVNNGMNILITSNINVPAFVTLFGQGESPHGGGYAPNTRNQGCISPANNASITMQKGSSLYGLTIMKNGISFTESGSGNFSGTAISVVDSDVGVVNCAILGFTQGISAVGSPTVSVARIRITDCNMDCDNCVYLEEVFDIPYVTRVHCFPFLSVNTLTASSYIRTGTAFRFANVGDWNKIQSCFCYGYLNGFVIENCNNIELSACGSDNIVGGYPGSVGFTLTGFCNETKLVGCQAAASQTGYLVNTTDQNTYTTFDSCDGWGLTGTGLVVSSGSCSFIGGTFARLPQGINITNANSYVYITGTAFNTITGTFAITSSVNTSRCGIKNVMMGSVGSGVTPVKSSIQTPTVGIFVSNL